MVLVFIRAISGRLFPLDVAGHATAENLLDAVELREGVPRPLFRLIGPQGKDISEHGWSDQVTLSMVMRIAGGGASCSKPSADAVLLQPLASDKALRDRHLKYHTDALLVEWWDLDHVALSGDELEQCKQLDGSLVLRRLSLLSTTAPSSSSSQLSRKPTVSCLILLQ